jgi:hypothetical protein
LIIVDFLDKAYPIAATVCKDRNCIPALFRIQTMIQILHKNLPESRRKEEEEGDWA